MIIGNNNVGGIKYSMTLNNSIYPLDTIEKQNDLGVIIDTKLSFDDHINQAVNKATKMTKIICRTFQFLDKDAFFFKIIHNLYDIESSPKLLKWEDVSFRTGNRGHTLKLFTQRAKTNIRKKKFPIRATEPWNSLPETVVQAKSLNTFKYRLDQLWSNQEILYNFEAPLKTGTGILKLLIDDKEDLIIEESQESCDQNHLKVS